MGIIVELEKLFGILTEVLPVIDALPLSPELAQIRTKLESALAVIKVVV